MAPTAPPLLKKAAPAKTPSLPPRVPGASSIPAPPAPLAHKAKTFQVAKCTGDQEGEKLLIYSGTGMGKTSLALLAPNPIFIPLDDGVRKMKHPITREPANYVPGIETFDDVRDALHQQDLWPTGSSCVFDTITVLEAVMEPWLFANIKTDRGQKVENLEGYGWGKGYKHSLDTLRLMFQDLDALVRRGVNIILLAQEQYVNIANPEGLDYIQACPQLHHDRRFSSMLEACSWVDHVVRIDYQDTAVVGDANSRAGKALGGDTTRVLRLQGARHFRAKSRTLPYESVRFESPADNALWEFLFNPQETV